HASKPRNELPAPHQRSPNPITPRCGTFLTRSVSISSGIVQLAKCPYSSWIWLQVATGLAQCSRLEVDTAYRKRPIKHHKEDQTGCDGRREDSHTDSRRHGSVDMYDSDHKKQQCCEDGDHVPLNRHDGRLAEHDALSPRFEQTLDSDNGAPLRDLLTHS